MPVESPIRVFAAVIRRADRWLLCQRPAHKRHGGRWEFPGGKLEPGEELADAARRELMEELGVDVMEVGDVVFSCHDEGSPFVIEFTNVAILGEPEAREHSALRWVSAAEAASLPLAPADHDFVREVLSGPAGD